MCEHSSLQVDWATHRITCEDCNHTIDPVWAFAVTLERSNLRSDQNSLTLFEPEHEAMQVGGS